MLNHLFSWKEIAADKNIWINWRNCLWKINFGQNDGVEPEFRIIYN